MIADLHSGPGFSPEPDGPATSLVASRRDSDDSCGRLRQRSELMARLKTIPALSVVLVIDDCANDVRSITTILKLLQGATLEVRAAHSLGTALDQFRTRPPQVVFLDDWLGPAENADTSIAFLRRVGYTGPIVMIAGEVTRRRAMQLREKGAAAVVSKDDLDGMTLAAVLIEIAEHRGDGGTPATG
jgi:CheY-like chemotaxis protein